MATTQHRAVPQHRRPLKQALIVALGGGLGAVIRWQLSALNSSSWMPLGTLSANMIGCLAIGMVLGVLQPGSNAFLFLAAGLCGALTTFSSFAVELLDAPRPALALAYAVLSLSAGLALVMVGLRIGRAG